MTAVIRRVPVRLGPVRGIGPTSGNRAFDGAGFTPDALTRVFVPGELLFAIVPKLREPAA